MGLNCSLSSRRHATSIALQSESLYTRPQLTRARFYKGKQVASEEQDLIVKRRQTPRQRAVKIAAIQAALIVVVALLWLLFNSWISASLVLSAGLAHALPNCLLSLFLFQLVKQGSAETKGKQLALWLFIGEFLKLALTGLVLGLLLAYVPHALGPCLSGFAAAIVGYFIAPAFVPID